MEARRCGYLKNVFLLAETEGNVASLLTCSGSACTTFMPLPSPEVFKVIHGQFEEPILISPTQLHLGSLSYIFSLIVTV